MKKAVVMIISVVGLLLLGAFAFLPGRTLANVGEMVNVPEPEPVVTDGGFEVEVLVNGRPLEEYAARGRRYVEALEGEEYEIRVHNPLGVRVAVALSVDGLNTIDARRTSAWDASKWVIEPYGTITISGWQMSSSRARRFYFTTESDSYGAKIGQSGNLGVISAVFFRENRPIVVVPPPRPPRPYEDRRIDRDEERRGSKETTPQESDKGAGAQSKTAEASPRPDDDYAATGIGRNVRNDVTWINLNLDSHPSGEITIRYEYHDALVRLGIIPRRYPRPDALRRREGSTGFEDRRYSPEP
ncbi:MAG: hypothetical protein M3362_13245 [Acidobacteriota bacterium]|nr:hypothetical protein [Acidobacteriota bacterium]